MEPYREQAAAPCELTQPYWSIYLDAKNLPRKNQYLKIHLAKGRRLDVGVLKELMEALDRWNGRE